MPHAIADGLPAFVDAELQEVVERIHASSRDVRVRRQITSASKSARGSRPSWMRTLAAPGVQQVAVAQASGAHLMRATEMPLRFLLVGTSLHFRGASFANPARQPHMPSFTACRPS
jgi:hypothetical protein